MNDLSILYRAQGLYEKAEAAGKRALSLREQSLGPDHPDTAVSLANIASLYQDQGFYTQAEPLIKRALKIQERSLGPGHPDTAASLNNLASLYHSQGLLRQAEPLYKKALAIREQSLGGEHPDVVVNIINLAQLYSDQGLYSQAAPLYKRALITQEKAHGPDHPLIAVALNNLAAVYRHQGLYKKAESHYLRALEINERILGPSHPSLANNLSNLAFLYGIQGLYVQAGALHERALEVRRRVLGLDHPDTAISLNNLAVHYQSQGLYSQAEPLFKLALAVNRRALGFNHPNTATSLSNLAVFYGSQRLYRQAEPLHKSAMEIREKHLGADHPDVAKSTENLAFLYFDLDQAVRSWELLVRTVRSQTRLLIREGSAQARLRRSALDDSLGKAWELSFSLANRDQTGPQLALSIRLMRHGLMAQIEQRQALLRRSLPAIREISEELSGINQRLSGAQLALNDRTALRQQRDALEQELYRKLPDLQIPEISPAQVAEALPPDGVLVEFQRYRPWLGTAADSKTNWGAARYLALVLTPDSASRAVILGPAAPIDASITKALVASADAQSDASERWAEVGRLVLDPLRPLLVGRHQWFLSPDGELHRVPFAALPASSGPGNVLTQEVKLRMLTSGRDLVQLQTPAPTGQPAIVMASPNFSHGEPTSPELLATAVPQQRSADMRAEGWAPLPATAAEGRQIAGLLGTSLISGDEATVTSLQQVRGPKLLHIASHGYFLGDQEPLSDSPGRTGESGGAGVQRLQGEDPLLRSGIVLAGANNPERNPADDGLLTSLEATALDLDGTELVVLSACSTGLGDIRVGEGVAGLQSALAVAGARSSLLSLWKVDDKATAAFMEAFYQRLKNGEGRADALAGTQAEFRNHPIAAWRHPYYWAAWQLVGDWLPIQGL